MVIESRSKHGHAVPCRTCPSFLPCCLVLRRGPHRFVRCCYRAPCSPPLLTSGEKQIETDKRLLRDRASALRKELESVRTHRRNYRERRSIMPVPVVALVGYTNAGKSTLLNTLTQVGPEACGAHGFG